VTDSRRLVTDSRSLVTDSRSLVTDSRSRVVSAGQRLEKLCLCERFYTGCHQCNRLVLGVTNLFDLCFAYPVSRTIAAGRFRAALYSSR